MLYYSLEMPAGLEQAGPEASEMVETLESLVAAWDGEVERARAAERRVAGPGPAAEKELDVLRRSHRALVETLERSISQLEALHARTAGLVRAVNATGRPAAYPRGRSGLSASLPASETADPSDLDGGLCLTASGPTEFPTSDETDMIDMTNRLALATLDVPSRWRPLKRRRAVRQAARS